MNKEMIMEVNIKNIEGMRLAAVRHVGPYENCKTAWDTLCAWAGPKGLLKDETLYIGIGHDSPEIVPPEQCRYDACITVNDDFIAEAPVAEASIPPGEYASAIHKGPYEELARTWAAMFKEWLPTSGREFREGPCFELYLNDPEKTPPEELLTEVFVPLK